MQKVTILMPLPVYDRPSAIGNRHSTISDTLASIPVPLDVPPVIAPIG